MKKTISKIMALVIAMGMMVAMAIPTMAATITINSGADTDEAFAETTTYHAWKLLDADIEVAPNVNLDGTTANQGEVAYFTTSASAMEALEEAGLFTFTKVGDEDKWYATPKNGLTAAEVTGAFSNWTDEQMDSAFGSPETGAQTEPGGSATINAANPGYYYIKSTLGDEIAVQTLADVTIKTKNEYVTHKKELTYPDKDANVQVGDEVSYTLEVDIPESANDIIVLTDVMDDGLTFKSIDDTFSDDVVYTFEPAEKTAEAVTNNKNTFELTISKEDVIANKGKTLSINYVAVVNNNAVVAVPEKNTVTLNYGDHYTSKPKKAEVVTHKFTFDKVDGSTKLTGAEFELWLNEQALPLVVVTEGEEYRIATTEDPNTTTTIVTAGKTITINGVDSDVTYQLKETKAPAGGYNLLEEAETVEVKADDSSHIDVENNKGSVLPSTGGMGTTIFYVIGGILVLAAAIILISKRRVQQ